MPHPSNGRAAREGGRLGLNNNDSWHLTKRELLPGSHRSRIPVHGTLDFYLFREILHRMFIVVIAFNIAMSIVCL